MTYTQEEIHYLEIELQRLENARNEKYSKEVLDEWKLSFQEEGYIADQACRMVRKVRLANNIFKVKFSDFIAMDISDMPNIIPVKNLLPAGDSERIAGEKEADILRTQELIANVRNILDLSFFDFIIEAHDRGYNHHEYYEYLLVNPDDTKCVRLSEKQKELYRGDTEKLSDIIKNKL